MINMHNYTREDLLLIKGHLTTLVLCVVAIGAIFWATRYIDSSADTELQQARSRIAEVRGSIDKIQLEENLASQYVERYRTLQANGVIGDEDRLHLLELFARIRAQHQLFPISISIHEQAELALPYETNIDDAAEPVRLRSSVLEIGIPLLHEEDLSRLLDDLLQSSWFLQPVSCRISDNNPGNTTYYYLDRHFAASCVMNWYTFDVTPAGPRP